MIDFKRPKKEDYDFNDNIEGVRYAKDMNDYADKLEDQLRLYNVSKRFCWLEMPKGKFSDTWDNDTNEKFLTDDLIDYANKGGFKLIEYKCVNDENFEFYNQMRLK